MAADADDEDYRAQVRVMSQAMPAAVSISNAAGVVLWVNPFWSSFTGVSFADSVGQGWHGSVHADDLPALTAAFSAGRERGEGFVAEVRLRSAAGDWRWSKIRGEPLVNAKSRIEGWISVATDIDEQVRSNLALHESEERFRLMAENAPVNLWMGDADGRCVYLNRMQREFWGVADDLSDFSWGDTLLEEDRDALFNVFGAAMQTQSPFEVEARYRRADGAMRTLRTSARPRHDANGAFLGMIGVNTDVTEARRAELHQRLLVNELNHRVKNTLATVQSLADQTLRASQDVGQAKDVLEGRLMALSAAHNVLNRENWDAADLSVVVSEALRPFDSPGGQRFRVRGPSARIAPRAALAVSLVLHELATNAVKYGALSCEQGCVALTWDEGDGEKVNVLWREVGGPPVAPPARQGFGTRLLAGVAVDLGAAAALDYRPDGLECRFDAPMATFEPDEFGGL
jgi:PAS domain S-box-containing protein